MARLKMPGCTSGASRKKRKKAKFQGKQKKNEKVEVEDDNIKPMVISESDYKDIFGESDEVGPL